jgi:hypothetical protein
MPRAAELADVSACPVCGHTGADALDLEPEPAIRERPEQATPPVAHAPGSPRARFGVGLAVGFALGALAGVGGLRAAEGQWPFARTPHDDNTTTAQADPAPQQAPAPAATSTPPNHIAGYTPPDPSTIGVPNTTTADHGPGLMPLGTVPVPDEPRPAPQLPPMPEPVPVPQLPPLPAGQQKVIEVNEPNGVYTLPFAVQNPVRVVLKGKAKVFRLPAVGGGATVDASALDAREVHVGRIDGGATVKLNSPEGTVTFAGKIDAQAVVDVNAPGGEVIFPAPAPGQDGAAVDNGSKLTVTAKRVSIRGDVKGAATRVHVTLTRAGTLHIGTVQGTAVVEYRSATSGWSYSTVSVGPVAPSATVRELGPKSDAVVNDN